MSLLSKLFKPKVVMKEHIFTISKGFKGYKKFPMVVYGDDLSMNNNELLKGADFRGHTIIFRPSTANNAPFFQVFIDNIKVGAIFDKEQIQALNSGRVVSVFALPEEEKVAGQGKIVTRNKIRLFVKYEV